MQWADGQPEPAALAELLLINPLGITLTPLPPEARPMSGRLFALLPAVHRVRDRAQGDPLRALLAVIEREVERVEGDIAGLYDNWFIETCDAWVVPYIGDLLGVRGLLPTTGGAFTQRGYVANTLAYRRRKGTAAVLEQLARDLTGWPARAVEFFARLATTQHVNHVRLAAPATVDIRSAYALQFVGTPFETAMHTGEVRHIDNGRGRYNIPHVGLFLWRLQSYLLTDVTARRVDARRFIFDPLGGRRDAVQRAGDRDGPDASRRAVQRPDAAHAAHAPPGSGPLLRDADDVNSVRVRIGPAVQPVESGRRVRPVGRRPAASGRTTRRPGKIALDPQLGRIAFADAPSRRGAGELRPRVRRRSRRRAVRPARLARRRAEGRHDLAGRGDAESARGADADQGHAGRRGDGVEPAAAGIARRDRPDGQPDATRRI